MWGDKIAVIQHKGDRWMGFFRGAPKARVKLLSAFP